MESVADNVNELIKKQPTLNKYILKTIIMKTTTEELIEKTKLFNYGK